MVWTRRQLDQAVMEYERVLTEAQQAPGSIRTAVGDARRFVRWLDGEFHPRAREDSGGSRRPRSAEATRRPPLRGLVSAPNELMTLIEQLNKQGRPPQVGIEWPRERWRAAFPGQRTLWRDLPDLLDRKSVRYHRPGSREPCGGRDRFDRDVGLGLWLGRLWAAPCGQDALVEPQQPPAPTSRGHARPRRRGDGRVPRPRARTSDQGARASLWAKAWLSDLLERSMKHADPRGRC